ncbi:hypothetical protein OIV83_000807 [Microbotryomycetes sp. JL201]|nr:hypothetical protein OIV83_000807 [Microbotryomycetes sp. JL201]
MARASQSSRTTAYKCLLVTLLLTSAGALFLTSAVGVSREQVQLWKAHGLRPLSIPDVEVPLQAVREQSENHVDTLESDPVPLARESPTKQSQDKEVPSRPLRPTCNRDMSIEQEYGSLNVQLSRDHVGTRIRLAKVFDKLDKGQKIKIGVLGGSVSSGHGNSHAVHKQDRVIQNPWSAFVKAWFDERYNDQVEFVSGAVPAVDSSFFFWCWPAKLGGEDVDLVFLETAVNDQYSVESMQYSEDLLRSLLESPRQPAVIYVDAFALHSGQTRKTTTETDRGNGILDGADAHLPLARFYDVPEISVRDPVLPTLLETPQLQDQYFAGDSRHIAAPLHRYLGHMVVSFLQDALCQTREILQSLDERNQISSPWSRRTKAWVGGVPRVKISQAWDSPSVPKSVPPSCQLAGHGLSPVPVNPDEPLKWSLYTWRYDKQYLQALEPKSSVRFNVTVNSGGRGLVAVSFLRTRAEPGLGRLRCRIEGQESTLDGWWDKSTSVSETKVVATGLQDGRSFELECATEQDDQGRSAFRIMSVQTM